MAALEEARGHLRKAREFLEAGELTLELDMFDAATSSAVHSGINSKDAICLKLTGTTGKSQNHDDASAELRRAGRRAAAVAGDLKRLITAKPKAEYQSIAMARTEAAKAVERARRLYNAALEIVTTN